MSGYISIDPNDEQENMFSQSNNAGRVNGRGSARAWEECLDDVVSQTDESIEKLKEMHRPKQRLASLPIKSTNTPLTVGTRPRSASTSRAPTPVSTPIQNRESEDQALSLERKVEFLFRRTKMLRAE